MLMRVTIVLTKQCNLKCPYCHISKRADRMGKDILLKAVDMATETSNPSAEIHFFGGEPLLERELLAEAVKQARYRAKQNRRSVSFLLSTNCLDADIYFIDWISEQPFSLEISLDGSHGSNSDNQCYTKPGHFKIAAKHASDFVKSGVECFANMVVTPETVGFLAENFDDVLSTGISRVSISPATGILWKKKAAETLAAGLWEIYKKHVRPGRIRLLNLEQAADDMLFNREITVDCDGTVYSGNAYLYSPDTLANEFKIGHVNDKLTLRDYYKRRLPLSFYVNNVFAPEITMSYSNVIQVFKKFRYYAANERMSGLWRNEAVEDVFPE